MGFYLVIGAFIVFLLLLLRAMRRKSSGANHSGDGEARVWMAAAASSAISVATVVAVMVVAAETEFCRPAPVAIRCPVSSAAECRGFSIDRGHVVLRNGAMLLAGPAFCER